VESGDGAAEIGPILAFSAAFGRLRPDCLIDGDATVPASALRAPNHPDTGAHRARLARQRTQTAS
jgi:hypothetical protein